MGKHPGKKSEKWIETRARKGRTRTVRRGHDRNSAGNHATRAGGRVSREGLGEWCGKSENLWATAANVVGSRAHSGRPTQPPVRRRRIRPDVGFFPPDVRGFGASAHASAGTATTFRRLPANSDQRPETWWRRRSIRADSGDLERDARDFRASGENFTQRAATAVRRPEHGWRSRGIR